MKRKIKSSNFAAGNEAQFGRQQKQPKNNINQINKKV